MANYYVTVAGAGDNSGDSWANALTVSEFVMSVNSAIAGDSYYVAGGTYTFGASINTAADGTGSSPISIIGVNSGTTAEPPTVSDYATGSSRPLFSCGAYTITIDNYWKFLNIRASGTHQDFV